MGRIRELMMLAGCGGSGGADFVKGTFTVPGAGETYTLNFGKTFGKYLFFIEMTDDSKSTLLNTGITSARAFYVEGIYPKRSVNNVEANDAFIYRVAPSTGVISSTYNGAIVSNRGSTSLTLTTGSTSNTNVFFNGYSYNYYIVEIK